MTMPPLFAFSCAPLGDAALVGFRGKEAISTLYDLQVFVTVPVEAAVTTADLVRQRLSLTIDRGAGRPPAHLNGVIRAAEIVTQIKERALWRLHAVPKLWELSLTRHSRLFTGDKIPDVLEKTLKAAGFAGSDYTLHLGSYSPEEHVCQYHESDLAFISRWLEREGIHYFFEQGDDQEKLVIADTSFAPETLPSDPVRYFGQAGSDASGSAERDFFDRFVSRHQIKPAEVRLQDYDYAKPQLQVTGTEAVSTGGTAAVHAHGGRFFTPGDGGRLAKVRAEEHRAGQTVFRGEGRVFQLRPGYLFELGEHPRSAMNTRYLCTALEHEANLGATTPELRALTGLHTDEVYRARVTAIAAAVPFRPRRVTPWPRISGFEAAVVDGPADSDYAQLDDQGRYLVKTHFDESDLKDGKATTRIRMLQPHGGNPEGFHFPLRKGTEVLLAFLAGDPDRPVIAGAVPNAQTPSKVTSTNHTKNVIHTGGDNRVEIEDQAEQQHIDVQTVPKNTFLHLGEPHKPEVAKKPVKHTHYIVENTEGDCLFNIGSNQDINVGGALTENVTGAVKETYKTSQTSTITGPQSTTVGGAVTELYKSTQLTEVGGAVTEKYAAAQITLTSGDRMEKYTGGQKTTVTGPVVEIYAASHGKQVAGDTNQKYLGALITKVGGPVSQNFGPTTLNYGATVAIHKKVEWNISGSCDVFTPSWTVLGCDATLVQANVEKINGTEVEFNDITMAFAAVKLEATGFAVGNNTIKIKAVGVAMAVWGLYNANYGVKLLIGGDKEKKTGFFVLA